MPPEAFFGKLGVLAGGGALPRLLAGAWRDRGGEVFVLAFDGITDDDSVSGTDHARIGLGKVGEAIRLLRDNGCDSVVMAGAMRRPSWSALTPDLRGAALIPRLAAAKGDDGILRVIAAELESEGFRVVGADDILSDLLAAPGALGARQPNAADWRDIHAAAAAALAIGTADAGQAAVARDGVVIGTEGAAGTDALLEQCAAVGGQGGVLVKRPKPGQDRRADLP
ncbi:MAG: UDP-2,3-diacylglucosamine diphosphatase LpxI, partial [Proteobacteria bacterium]|nr:UDP-2,3-diacylglucosamine diphosphatase LpxI [Pseudomonadota bacterium]